MKTRTTALLFSMIGTLCPASWSWSASGTVSSTAGGALAGVSIGIQDSSKYTAVSDASGAFKLESVSSGIVVRNGGAERSTAELLDGILTVRGPREGRLELSLVDPSGRSLWARVVQSEAGVARTPLSRSIARGAIFLRIRHAQGVEHVAVGAGNSGFRIEPEIPAAREAAAFPVLTFKKTGYVDTSFAMTASSMDKIAVSMRPSPTCDLPTSFKWKDYGKPIAEPKNGWLAIKDFTMVRYNNQYIVYMTYTPTGGGFKAAYMAPFSEFSQANSATQGVMPNNLPGVAPELIYFTPKKQWVFTTQWCGGGFCYTTGSDPTKPTSFAATTQSLLSENITSAGNPLESNKGSDTGPIDQVVICDDDNCYLFYNDDNGRVYRASMPKASFPGKFSGSKMIIQDNKTRLFEAIEVYKLKGQKKYLMIVECAWTRYFRAFTATDLGGDWTPLGNTREKATPFAGAKNVTGGWSTDISHGEIVRTGFDEYREIDPCNLQMIYQGKNGGGDYDKLPYRMGLLTLVR